MDCFIDNSTRIIDLTLGDLLAAVRRQVDEAINDEAKRRLEQERRERYVYGLEGIMKLYDCSKSTACRIKRSGMIDPAITQVGNKIVVDTEVALRHLPKH